MVDVLGDSMLAHLHCRHVVMHYIAYSQFASSAVQDALDGMVLHHVRHLC